MILMYTDIALIRPIFSEIFAQCLKEFENNEKSNHHFFLLFRIKRTDQRSCYSKNGCFFFF